MQLRLKILLKCEAFTQCVGKKACLPEVNASALLFSTCVGKYGHILQFKQRREAMAYFNK